MSKEDANHYHKLTAKLVYLAPRARPHLLTAVSFLCTRVQCPTQEDWSKLSRTKCYLDKTKNLFLTLEVDYTQSGKQPAIIQFEHIPDEMSDFTMTIDDNGTESVESNLESNIPSGGDDRINIPSRGDDRTEEDEDTNGEEEGTPLKDNDHDLGSDDIEDADHYHKLTAKLVYLAPRARPDLLTAVSFLCTRVQCPTQEDLSNLSRTIRYLDKTKNLFLTLEVDELQQLKCYVDSAPMLHHDLKGHTEGFTSFGSGVFSTKFHVVV